MAFFRFGALHKENNEIKTQRKFPAIPYIFLAQQNLQSLTEHDILEIEEKNYNVKSKVMTQPVIAPELLLLYLPTVSKYPPDSERRLMEMGLIQPKQPSLLQRPLGVPSNSELQEQLSQAQSDIQQLQHEVS